MTAGALEHVEKALGAWRLICYVRPMKTYALAALSFFAGAGLAIVILAPTLRQVPKLTARVKVLEAEATRTAATEANARANDANGEIRLKNLLRLYTNRIEDLERALNQEQRVCLIRPPEAPRT